MEDLGKVFREFRMSKNYSLKEAAGEACSKLQATNETGELMDSQQQIDQLTAAQEEAMIEWEELAEKV